MNTTKTRRHPAGFARARVILLAAAAGMTATLAGCGDHGAYTQDHINTAKEKLALIKSGTEWKMSQQQFLAGDLDKAAKTIDRSLQLNPLVTKSHVLKARILLEQGKLEQARASLLEAERLDPDSVEAQYYLGIVHERFSEPEKALGRYQKAARLDTGNAQYVIAASEMLVQLDRLDDAETLLSENKQNFQYNAAVRQSLGHLAMLRNNYPGAVATFGEARLLAPDDLTVLEDLVRALVAAGNYAEAEFNIGKLLEANSGQERRDLQHIRARCLSRIDRPVEARAILLDLTGGKEGAGDLRAWIELGNVAAALDDSARLKAAGARAVALAPERYEGHFLKSLNLHRQGADSAALLTLEKAVALSESDPGPLVLRALIEQTMGRPEDARRSLAAALAMDPASKTAKELLATIVPESGVAVVGHGAAAE